jgi:iron only hydrogenase large subunit-like protein
MALAYGFRNIQNIVQKIKRGKCQYHFVEIMACPSGCTNGGGQIRPEGEVTPKDRLVQVTELYNSVQTVNPWTQSDVQKLYSDWLGGTDTEKCKQMLHTQYHEVEKMTNALAIKW